MGLIAHAHTTVISGSGGSFHPFQASKHPLGHGLRMLGSRFNDGRTRYVRIHVGQDVGPADQSYPIGLWSRSPVRRHQIQEGKQQQQPPPFRRGSRGSYLVDASEVRGIPGSDLQTTGRSWLHGPLNWKKRLVGQCRKRQFCLRGYPWSSSLSSESRPPVKKIVLILF